MLRRHGLEVAHYHYKSSWQSSKLTEKAAFGGEKLNILSYNTGLTTGQNFILVAHTFHPNFPVFFTRMYPLYPWNFATLNKSHALMDWLIRALTAMLTNSLCGFCLYTTLVWIRGKMAIMKAFQLWKPLNLWMIKLTSSESKCHVTSAKYQLPNGCFSQLNFSTV